MLNHKSRKAKFTDFLIRLGLIEDRPLHVTIMPELIDQKIYHNALLVVAAAKDLVWELESETYYDVPLPDELNDLKDQIDRFETKSA